jgi:hypothetical protein
MCFCMIFKITFSRSLPVVGKSLMGRKFLGNLGSLPSFGKAITFASFQGVGKCWSRMQLSNKWVRCTSGLLGRSLRHSFGIPSIPQAFLIFNEFIIFWTSQGLTLSGGSVSTASSRAWTLASTRLSWFSSHRLCGVNWFSKQSAITLALSIGRYLRPKGPWMAVGALGPSLCVRNFAMGHIAWGVSSVFDRTVSHRSSAFFSGHTSNCFWDPIYCPFTFWIPGFLPKFPHLFLIS